ncbi:MAG: restriction endonuclease subunit S [Rhodospirillales bacterium]|nr:restriction endonuclease subunit S [Rhodospirillales bacterium]
MKLIKLTDLFLIEYGNQLDLNKLIKAENGINFVNRSAKNLGISAKVKKIDNIEPYEAGLLTVALGGSVLSSFVQPKAFYTGQNVKVLKPKLKMNDLLKKYYCFAINKNAFRYSTCGREANSTFDNLLVPSLDEAKKVVSKIPTKKEPSAKSITNISIELNERNYEWFELDDIFDVKKGKRLTKADMTNGTTPFIGAIDTDNGWTAFIGQPAIFSQNTITVNYNGNGVAESFYQDTPFWASDDVNVLYPKFKMNAFNALFLITLIRQEKYRFSYGRKWHQERMKKSKIKLPIDQQGNPDWQFMENYIKSLPYSAAL